jgi:hypothetical protein
MLPEAIRGSVLVKANEFGFFSELFRRGRRPAEETIMNTMTRLAICILLLAGLEAVATGAQSRQPCETSSLGALARKLKAERAKQPQKPVATFTNDSLPYEYPGRVESNTAAQNEKAKESSKAPAASSPAGVKEHGEKYFRSQAQDIRSRVELHQRELAVLEQKLGLASTEYSGNPQNTLEQESTPAFHHDLNKLREEIDAKKQRIADDEKAMNNLRDELRKDGGDPGWLR